MLNCVHSGLRCFIERVPINVAPIAALLPAALPFQVQPWLAGANPGQPQHGTCRLLRAGQISSTVSKGVGQTAANHGGASEGDATQHGEDQGVFGSRCAGLVALQSLQDLHHNTTSHYCGHHGQLTIPSRNLGQGDHR